MKLSNIFNAEMKILFVYFYEWKKNQIIFTFIPIHQYNSKKNQTKMHIGANRSWNLIHGEFLFFND